MADGFPVRTQRSKPVADGFPVRTQRTKTVADGFPVRNNIKNMTKERRTMIQRRKKQRSGEAIKALLLVLLAAVAASCDRRELYVTGDDYYSLRLNVDWSDYSDNPDGMTTWFFPLDRDNPTDDPEQMTNNDRKPYQNTTANVTRENLYLPSGRYQGVVINYSPQEYGRQDFHDMENIHEARVEMAPGDVQAETFTLPGKFVTIESQNAAREKLFGESAIVRADLQKPNKLFGGYYEASEQPEPIAADTLHNRTLNSGSIYGDYIPYEQRNSYQKEITVNELNSKPHNLVWTTTVRVYIEKGFQNLWQVKGTLSGLASGHYLARHTNTDKSSIIILDEWKREGTAGDDGWITCTISCFGLCPTSINSEAAEYHPSEKSGKSIFDGRLCDIDAFFSKVCLKESLRLNLVFILRDQKSTVAKNYGIGNAVVSYADQMYIETKVSKDYLAGDKEDPIILPDVTPYEDPAAGFGADVTPWADGGTADETM